MNKKNLFENLIGTTGPKGHKSTRKITARKRLKPEIIMDNFGLNNVKKSGKKQASVLTGKKNNRQIIFGSVKSVVNIEPEKKRVIRNIKAGQKALRGLKAQIVTPGIKIKSSKSVPLFYANPDDPDEIIRDCNGKKEKGFFINGKFSQRQ